MLAISNQNAKHKIKQKWKNDMFPDLRQWPLWVPDLDDADLKPPRLAHSGWAGNTTPIIVIVITTATIIVIAIIATTIIVITIITITIILLFVFYVALNITTINITSFLRPPHFFIVTNMLNCLPLFVHMGQFVQGGKNGCLMSFFLQEEPPCDQTWWYSPVFSIVSCLSYVLSAKNTLVRPVGPF